MAGIEMAVDLSTLIDALVAGNTDQIIARAREHLRQGESAEVLIGRVGLVAARGDSDGHTIITLAAIAMLSRLLHTLPQPLEGEVQLHERALPLFVQAMLIAAPSVRAGRNKELQLPAPLYPSGLGEKGSVSVSMHEAVYKGDALMVERLLLGLYGTGADYRTMQVRAYDGISTTFQDVGHPLMFVVRGFQLLDTVEWGDRVAGILHWLAPFLPLRASSNEPEWVKALRTYNNDPAHSLASIRTRIAVPKEENALPLRDLILSDADTTKVCQGVYDAIIPGGASPRAVGSVIALAAADVMRKINDGDRAAFIRTAHGLLFAAAVRLVFRQVQDVDVLPLLFTSAAYVNALMKETAIQDGATQSTTTPASSAIVGGGLIAPSQLETLTAQLQGQDLRGALATAQRYLKLTYDIHSLFATIALAAARINAVDDQGHTLQIVQAASEEYMAWPKSLAATNHEALLQVALRAAAFGKRNPVMAQL